ncbi:translocation/assembly module TamB domain-containing protein [Cellulophaga baltica]|uniref:translocation/assembly module TamB domain-containing protein n=1 Tax=Cellulophaga TaxID=104264 RepID=UPI001C06C093|nr:MULTISPECIES: translocation/assembly module TamB [Cellulophaga]MBU2997270.1 translocation/assembly module TamB domain-containing protein [Cellulophaga baltica]MDO6768668.1 translocation/assembly module TamB domain-containing protein [Cellulophaga sp. 1_MG-2023]
MKKKQKRIFRRVLRIFAVLLLLFIGIILFIRSQWGQDIIVTKVIKYVSDKTNTEIRIDKLFVTFSGNLYLEGLYLEDTKGDTLVYSKTLEANVPFMPIITGTSVSLNSLTWEGLKANVTREEGTEDFNFSFLVNAFATQDTVPTTTESEPLNLSIGDIILSDFDITYKDDFLGIESAVKLGTFEVVFDELDLEKMRYVIDDIELQNTTINYKQTKPFITTEDTTTTQLPYIEIGDVEFKNVKADYNSVIDKQIANVTIGNFNLQLNKADLETNTFEIDRLALNNSNISFKAEAPATITNDSIATETTSPFEWPAYKFTLNELNFENNNLNYQAGNTPAEVGTFNANAIEISNFNLKTSDLSYEAGKAALSLETFSFKEKSGFMLKDFAFNANLEDTEATITDLKLKTNNSELYGKASLKYNALQQLIDAPENSFFNIELPKFAINISDAFIFQPDLKNNENIAKTAENNITGNVTASGSLKAVQIPDLIINWGENTQVLAQGELGNLTQPDSLSFNFKTIKATSNRKDILNFIHEEDLGVSVPNTINLNAIASGTATDATGEIQVKIPEGTAKITGNFKNTNQIAFGGNLKIDSLQLNKLLKNDQLGALSFTMDVSGSGSSVNTLNAKLATDFRQLEFKKYDFSNLKLDGEIVNGKGAINLNFKDKNLNLNADTNINLDSTASAIKLNLNIIGADLYALGVTNENIKIASQLNTEFSGNADDFTLNATIKETIAVLNNEQYRMGELNLASKIDTSSTKFEVSSRFLNGNLKANSSINKLNTALQQQFKYYFSDSIVENETTNPIVLNMDFKLRPTPILTEVFLRDVERLDTISISADFNSITKNLNASLILPSAMYNGSSVDSLQVSVNGSANDLNFIASLNSLSSDPILIKKTVFEGVLKNNAMDLDFTSYDDDQKLLHIASELILAKDTTKLHINPSELIFNKKQWNIYEDNNIYIGENILDFNNVTFSNNTQELTLSNAIEGIDKEHFGVEFNNFKLQTFLSLLNPEEALASGLVDGSFVVENPFGATGIIADFSINKLNALQTPLGNLNLKANSVSNTGYNFDMALKDGNIDLDLTGDYTADATGAKLNLDLALNKLGLKVLESFTDNAVTDTSGSISGNVSLSGTTTDPIYEGNFAFNDTKFKISELNSVFKISNKNLKVDNSGLYLNNFTINDNNNNSFSVDGTIKTADITNPTFNLSLNANAFQVMNSTEEDNELFYGKASMDADILVKGDLNLPIVTGKFKIGELTDITYVVPESQLDIEERDGVVIFVNQKNPDAILTRKEEEESSSILKGYKVNTILQVDNNAVFNVIIDKKTGDNLQVSGEADLNFGMNAVGTMSLSGRYELNKGHYETILYNVVKRKFSIKEGSTITWNGSPTDADLDVTAIYNVDASATNLMSSLTSSEDSSVSSKYQQVLSFMVYLNVEGEILAPEISFSLDMAEEDQSAISGTVYEQVQQLNEQESELNKQVFSLLTLNRFFPSSGSDGSSGGTATIARSNVSKVLSSQLNTFSDKLLGNSGFQLGFDFDSYTDYTGDNPEDRTQLNINAQKKLFNNRLIVTAGSTVDVEGSAQTEDEETPIIGNVSLEYLLSEDGRYRLKGFRKNEYENIIDGQLIITGVALIFNKEFNSFSELFNPLKEDKKEQYKDKSDTEDNNE